MDDIIKQIVNIIENYNKIYKDIEEVESKLKNLSQEREGILKELEENRELEKEILSVIKSTPELKKKLNTDNILELYKQLLALKIKE